VFVYQARFYIRAVIVQREKFFHLKDLNQRILLQRKKIDYGRNTLKQFVIHWPSEIDKGFSRRSLFLHRLMESRKLEIACLSANSYGWNVVSVGSGNLSKNDQRIKHKKLHRFLLFAMLMFVTFLDVKLCYKC
jgi:hypothetical protein